MNTRTVLQGCKIFDGDQIHHDSALVVQGGMVEDIGTLNAKRGKDKLENFAGGFIVPGYVDLQVNGGGGIQFNDDPSLDAIKQICKTHIALGTTSLLVTLITTTPALTASAIEAAIDAQTAKVPGFLGLHLEGPHLAKARKGAHREDRIRPMHERDLTLLLDAKKHLRNLMVTLAPESVTHAQISALSAAGIIVSIGHSDATFEETHNACNAGATCITHLFNAMSPLAHREPGMVGAALANISLHASLIADGYHVHPEAIRIALAAKKGPGNIFLVSDAMAPIGTNQTSFVLDGRKINRSQGRLTLADGTLAGADIDLATAVKSIQTVDGMTLDRALKMATSYPADVLSENSKLGRLHPGSAANFLKLDNKLNVESVWYQGEKIDHI